MFLFIYLYRQLEDSRNGRLVILVQNTDPAVLIRRVRFILLRNEKLHANLFVKAYTKQYQVKIDLDNDLSKIQEVRTLFLGSAFSKFNARDR